MRRLYSALIPQGLLLLALMLTTLLYQQTAAAAAYLRTISWNTLHAGWSGQTNWNAYAAQMWNDYGTSSSANNGFDVAFLQEVMYADTAANITNALNNTTNYSWAYSSTGAIGRSSYKERYAVIYRTDRVQILSAYVWNDSGDKFEREPQIVKLRHIQTGEDYTFINWHTVFGTTAQRQAEIAEIAKVYQSVQNADGSDQDVILLGDHNREATSNYWANLTNMGVSNRVNDLTSINSSCAYASRYDHYWLNTSHTREYSSSGRDYISNLCTFRNGVSDHAPIWAQFYSTGSTD